jgi:hypothetical protein
VEELRLAVPEPNGDRVASPDQLAAAVSASRLVVGSPAPSSPFAPFLACPDLWPALDNAVSRQLLGVRRWRRYPGRPLEPSLRIVEWSPQSTAFVERIADASVPRRRPLSPRRT